MKKTLFLMLCVVVTGCAQEFESQYRLSGARISNASGKVTVTEEVVNKETEKQLVEMMSFLPVFKVGTPYNEVINKLVESKVEILKHEKSKVDVVFKMNLGDGSSNSMYTSYFFTEGKFVKMGYSAD